MTKAAVFAAAILGLAGAAQAVDVTFTGVGIHDTDLASPVDGGDYTLTYLASGSPVGTPHKWNNASSFWYGAAGTHASSEMAYLPGNTGTWQVTIAADPGFEILFDAYSMLRRNTATNHNISVDSNTNQNDALNQATTYDATLHSFTRTFAAGSKPTGTSIVFSFADTQDVAVDSYSFTVQAIPEPTVLTPMALAGMGMFLRRRRA